MNPLNQGTEVIKKNLLIDAIASRMVTLLYLFSFRYTRKEECKEVPEVGSFGFYKPNRISLNHILPMIQRESSFFHRV